MDYKAFTILYRAPGEDDTCRALRAAGFSHILTTDEKKAPRDALGLALAPANPYLITLDAADGFSADDVAKVADALLADGTALYIGTKKICGKPGLPAKLFGLLSGLPEGSDTSSLLGMTLEAAQSIAGMKSGDASFWFNMPLEARALNMEIRAVAIGDVCEHTPGFGLLTRSFKLYWVFLKFSIAAMIAYAVDLSTFYLFEQVFGMLADGEKVLYATILSRVLTSITTYVLNRGAVFKSHAKSTGTVVRFVILAAVQLVASWLLVWGIGSLLGGSDEVNTILKVIVDLVIFIASFGVSRDWVFKETDGIFK